MIKKCPKCKNEKPLTREFWSLSPNRKDGFDSLCKDCKKAKSKEISSNLSQQRRDAKRYLLNSQKPKARAKARDYWGTAQNYKCSVLTCLTKAEHLHHLDYAKPLDVVPYCAYHHKLDHEK